MSLLKRLFGGSSSAPKSAPKEAETIEYEGFRITPEPDKQPGGYRIGARIEKDEGGETLIHHMIRADTCNSLDEASALSVAKARQMIDQMGEALFG